jgi:hypothetical protein
MKSQPVVSLSVAASKMSLRPKRIWFDAMHSFGNGSYRKSRRTNSSSGSTRAVETPLTDLHQVMCLKIKFVAPFLVCVFFVPDCDALFIKVLLFWKKFKCIQNMILQMSPLLDAPHAAKEAYSYVKISYYTFIAFMRLKERASIPATRAAENNRRPSHLISKFLHKM